MSRTADILAKAGRQLPGYILKETVYRGTRTTVFRGMKVETQQSVAIKVLSDNYPSLKELIQFRNQYTIAKNLTIPGVVSPIGLERYGNSYCLVMADNGCISLADYVQHHPLDWSEVVSLGVQLAKILHDLHEHRVIHKDIKPANILIHPETKQIWLTDFGIATLLPKESQTLQSPKCLEGTLAYIAPEQTGRMNRGVDYRTDFYSFGVSLYQLLTGELPFTSEDRLELIHSHIAQKAKPIVHLNPEIPAMVGAIVEKLMSKNAEDRYQSALGLKHDLETCLNQWRELGEVRRFELALHDLSECFLIPEKIYGRDTEVQTLLDAFERVAQGASELMLVAGFSGIGKTAVVNEVHKPIVRQRGYFIKGKFDQYNRNIPFFAFIQAFRSLMTQLLGESDSSLAEWKTKILEAIGENGDVLLEVIPELEHVMGAQPIAPESSTASAQNRFNLVFSKFVRVFTQQEHPLAIFLDDLQWADSASLSLLKLLMADPDVDGKSLLILGAYRDNEVFPTHPLMLCIRDLQQEDASINTIELTSLTQADINGLLSDTLLASVDKTTPLSELIYKKTQGNPFFTIQFLKGLYEDGYIRFSKVENSWQYNLIQLAQIALTDDVAEFMVERLKKLPLTTQDALKISAYIGNSFDLNTLSATCKKTKIDISNDLWPALQAGLIVPESQIYSIQAENDFQDAYESCVIEYRFVHDRVQQAACELVSEAHRQETHRFIALALLEQNNPSILEEKIFLIAEQINQSKSLISENSERLQAVWINLKAGKKAGSSTAYNAALDYFEEAQELLDIESWCHNSELYLDVYLNLIEAHYLNGNFQQVEILSELVFECEHSFLKLVRIYELLALSKLGEQKLTAAIEVGLDALSNLDISLTIAPNPSDVEAIVSQVSELLQDFNLPELVGQPRMSDPYALAAMEILNTISVPAYLISDRLFLTIVLTQVKLSVSYGNCPISASTYSRYGIALCGVLNQIELGYQSGKLALNLLKEFDSAETKTRTLTMVGTLVLPWKDPLERSIPLLKEAYEVGAISGNFEPASLARLYESQLRYISGESLSELGERLKLYGDCIRRLKQDIHLSSQQLIQRVVQNLSSNTSDVTLLANTPEEEERLISHYEELHYNFGLFGAFYHKAAINFLFEYPEDCQRFLSKAKKYLSGVTSQPVIPLLVWYDALSSLALLSVHGHRELHEDFTNIDRCRYRLSEWAQLSPENHQHKLHLLDAERNRVLGHRFEAFELYDKAIAGAKANKYIQEEALANELAAKFYLSTGKDKVAAGYMQEAYYCYSRWGATAKTNDLERRYYSLLKPILQQEEYTFDPLLTLSDIAPSKISDHSSSSIPSDVRDDLNQTIDLSAILKSAQALSEIIHLNELLEALATTMLRNAGADSLQILLAEPDGSWYVRATATVDWVELHAVPLIGNSDLPVQLIQYVQHTRDILVIDDLETDLPILDRYLERYRPRSVICLPIVHRGDLKALLYLQNQSTAGVFSGDRITVLNFLCSQAAISIENARLFDQTLRVGANLRESQEQLRTTANSLPGLVYQFRIDAEGHASYPYLSDRATELLEVDRQTLQHSADPVIERIDPQDFNAYKVAVARSMNNLTPFIWTGRFRSLSGRVKWLEARSTPTQRDDGSCVWDGVMLDVTDRKAAEQSLLASESKFRTLLSNLDGVVYRCRNDRDWTMEFMSEAITALSGYPVSEFIHNQVRSYSSIIHPDDVDWVEEAVNQGLEPQKTFSMDYRIVHRDGSVRWVTENGRGIFNDANELEYLEGVIFDISDRKQAEAEQQRHLAILESTSDFIGTADPQGKILYLNAAWRRLLELEDGTPALRVDISEQHPPWALEIVLKDALPTASQSGMWVGETALLDGMGREIPVSQVVIAHTDEHGEVVYFSTIIRDMSDRKAYEERLEKNNAQLLHATRMKDEFLATMSHELRTPLNAILGMTECLQAEIFGAINSKQMDSLNTIDRSGNHLLGLINDILDLSKVASGKIELSQSPVDVAQLCYSCLQMVQQQAQNNNIQLQTSIPAVLPEFLFDEQRMEQVLLNLLSNAVKFTPEGGQVTLSVYPHTPQQIVETDTTQAATTEISATQTSAAQTLHIVVSDTGIGISPDHLGTLFQPFVQIDGALNRKYAGTGLGLALVKQIVEMHGGYVTVTSEVNVGSTFTIELPWKAVPDQHNLSTASIAPVPLEPSNNSGPTILVVEDDSANILTIRSFLKAKGYRVALAENGLEAIEIVQSLQPSLILMDIQMPVMDGLEATQTIRNDLGLSDIPIIALTALAMRGDREKCLAAGANEYLSKPVRLKQLDELLHQYVTTTDLAEERSSDQEPTSFLFGHQSLSVSQSQRDSIEEQFGDMPIEWQNSIHNAIFSLNDRAVRQLLAELPPGAQEVIDSIDVMMKEFRFDILMEILHIESPDIDTDTITRG